MKNDMANEKAGASGGEEQAPADRQATPEPMSPTPEGDAVDAFAAETASAERLSTPKEPDYKDRWLRAEAEIQNTRRRALRDREDAVRASEERILLDLVEALDDLERALAALPAEQLSNPWAQGVSLTAQRLRDALARRGVTPIATIGEPFDPAFHEALLEVAPPEGIRPGAVAQEVQKGYARGDRALRAARVVVARAEH
jgi:molecular chaperone GrpE